MAFVHHQVEALAVVAVLEAVLGVEEQLAVAVPVAVAAACGRSSCSVPACRSAEAFEQLVLQRQEELAAARVALARGAADELAVDAGGLVAFGAEDVQAAGLRDRLAFLADAVPGSRSRRRSAARCPAGTSMRGADTASLSCAQASVSALPPRRMSVPRPAMLVAIVTAPGRPAWATISASRSALPGLALSTWCGDAGRVQLAC